MANILFVRNTGRSTFATGPAKSVVCESAGVAELLERTLMLEGSKAVIERSTQSPGFLEAEMSLYFL